MDQESEDMIPKNRLGKRSPLGALLSSTCPTAGTRLDSVTMETTPGQHNANGHPPLRVYFQCGAAGQPSGVADQLDATFSPSSSSFVPPSCSRSVSSCIDVPRSRRTVQEVDELMAAMVLSSLSCSPLLHSPAPPDPAVPMMDGGGDLSDGSSGYWSVGHAPGSPAPSTPTTEPDCDMTTPPHSGMTTPPDEGLDMELYDEPTPRKRKNSMKVAFRCLWPSCEKVLTSTVGIKRHIRTTHLSGGAEHERCSRREEDFYYTEINQLEQAQPQAPPTPNLPSPSSPSSPPPSSPPSPPTLSRSAPSSSGSFWQVQSEHSYQAPPPSPVMSSGVLATPPSRCVAPPTSCPKQGLTFRVRSVSVGEQWLQHHSAPCRKIRGEAKKCRKVYGIEHRDLWCTACRWKKACQRFLD